MCYMHFNEEKCVDFAYTDKTNAEPQSLVKSNISVQVFPSQTQKDICYAI